MVTGVIPSPPRFLPSIFIAHRVQQSHCSSIVHRMLLTHALALSPSQFVHKKKFQRIYTSMHSAGLELTKLTYSRLEDNLIRHRGDRSIYMWSTENCWATEKTPIADALSTSCTRSCTHVGQFVTWFGWWHGCCVSLSDAGGNKIKVLGCKGTCPYGSKA